MQLRCFYGFDLNSKRSEKRENINFAGDNTQTKPAPAGGLTIACDMLQEKRSFTA